MQIKKNQEDKKDLITDIKQFPKELKKRNHLLYYLGNILSLIFILFIIGFTLCYNSIYEICHWLKPGKFSFSFALYAYSMGWFLYYLKDTISKKAIAAITLLITLIITLEMITMFVQSFMGSSSFLLLNFSPTKSEFVFEKLSIFSDALILVNTAITFFVGALFFKPLTLKPIEYLWSIRASFIIFNLSCVIGLALLLKYGQTPASADSLNFPFTQFTTNRMNLLSMHFIGLHAMQVIPLITYYFPGFFGKRFLASLTAIYCLVSALLLMQLVLYIFPKTMA